MVRRTNIDRSIASVQWDAALFRKNGGTSKAVLRFLIDRLTRLEKRIQQEEYWLRRESTLEKTRKKNW